jgi:transcriptional regulator with XRE-family HTH domain
MIVRMATDPRIGARIKIARARRGMSQQLSARTTVDSWENGRSQPKRGKVLGALERELGVSLFEPETLGDLAADVASASGLTEAQKAALLTLIQSQNHSKP